MKKHEKALIWLRRDLRLHDHTALAHASTVAKELAFVFVFDTSILKNLPQNDRRVTYIYQSLKQINETLEKRGSHLVVLHGNPTEEIPALAKKIKAQAVFTHKDYEPQAIARDAEVAKKLTSLKIEFVSFKDQVIFEEKETLNQSGMPFKVFTPYKNAWLKKLKLEHYECRDAKPYSLVASDLLPKTNWQLSKIGFEESDLVIAPGHKAAQKRLKNFVEQHISEYNTKRDFPAYDGTSGISVDLRFGTLSIRECVRAALSHKGAGAEIWLSELIWREFYQMILHQYPYVTKGAFKKECDAIKWPGKEEHFEAWCQGKTGYPIVDAAMRELNTTGKMHNRLRMVVASFLTKDLLVHWKKGEEYFALNLLDFDLAANNGGWQWCASTGCDAQPYFRIFNPYSQSEKFDPKGEYIKKHVPELKQVPVSEIHCPTPSMFLKYPEPLVDHSEQREKAIKLFKDIK